MIEESVELMELVEASFHEASSLRSRLPARGGVRPELLHRASDTFGVARLRQDAADGLEALDGALLEIAEQVGGRHASLGRRRESSEGVGFYRAERSIQSGGRRWRRECRSESLWRTESRVWGRPTAGNGLTLSPRSADRRTHVVA